MVTNYSYQWRKPSLLLLIKLIGRRSARAWRPLANALEQKLPTEMPQSEPYRVQVWPRFGMWLMEQMRSHVSPATSLDQAKQQFQELVLRNVPNTPAEAFSPRENKADAIVQELLREYEPMVGGRPGEGSFREPFAEIIHQAADLLGMNSIANQFLLHLQLEQPPRDGIEAGLQHAVLDDATNIAVYCDYLEEHSDAVATWLRNVSPSS